VELPKTPLSVKSVWPSWAVPEIAGLATGTGGSGRMTGEAAEFAEVAPETLVAVTTARRRAPMSAAWRM